MVKIPIGIPLVYLIDNDPDKAMTAVCIDTLDSFNAYEEGPHVAVLMPRLMELIWESPTTTPLFKLEGITLNRRSKTGVKSGTLQGLDGSYKGFHGWARGRAEHWKCFSRFTDKIVRGSGQHQEIIAGSSHPLLVDHASLHLPLEWQMAEFNDPFNNVVAFGGLDPGLTSCQGNNSRAANVVHRTIPEDSEPEARARKRVQKGMNNDRKQDMTQRRPLQERTAKRGNTDQDQLPIRRVRKRNIQIHRVQNLSQSGKSHLELGYWKNFGPFKATLASSIGAQGKNHGDFKDEEVILTLFVLIFRLVPGSDLGLFICYGLGASWETSDISSAN
ncbi:hypothetical protein K438DRAFT_1776201 [Mycena galopus ATCC 62051]|nr:hypothetical protein K438DRAFT_1776201 [Mycena galopus ATCC 62051]